jgi:ADP-ribose pyrophosphatase YjhB (NUDIX family)
MRSTLVAGGVVVGNDGMIVIVEQANNAWSLPKGHIEVGESALEAAVREIEEESGVKQLKLIRPLLSYQRFKTAIDGNDSKVEWKTISMFLFTTEQTILQSQDPVNPQAVWIDAENVAERLTHKKDKAFFTAIKSHI